MGRLQPLDLFLARHHLAGAGAGRETLDEVLQLRDLLLALLVVGLDAGADLRFRQHHVVVAAGVGDDRLIVDVRGVRADAVQEVPIVRDHDQRAFVAEQELAHPVDRIEVEVVGRLVEQQRFRLAEERLRQQDADLLAALHLGHLFPVQRLRDVEALQQNRRVGLRLVAVLVADDAFELAETHAFGVGQIAFLVEDFALLERAPQLVVAHHDSVDDAELVEGELILPQDADLGRAHDGAALRRLLAGQQLHERRLAGAVRAGQAVTPAGGESGGYIVEEDLRPEPHRHTLD